jgi:hypothetical protein
VLRGLANLTHTKINENGQVRDEKGMEYGSRGLDYTKVISGKIRENYSEDRDVDGPIILY